MIEVSGRNRPYHRFLFNIVVPVLPFVGYMAVKPCRFRLRVGVGVRIGIRVRIWIWIGVRTARTSNHLYSFPLLSV
jgi:hypothetical protein